MRDRDRRELKAVLLCQHLQHRDRLLAVRAVVIEQRDLLAFQLVEAPDLLGDVLNRDIGRRPVRAEQREIVREHGSILGIGAAIAHRDNRDLVSRGLFSEGECNASRQRIDEGPAGRVLAFETLVTLNALVGGIAGLAFLDQKLDAVDAAVALIDQVVIVGHAVCVRHAIHGVRARPVGQYRDELFVLRCSRSGKRCA